MPSERLIGNSGETMTTNIVLALVAALACGTAAAQQTPALSPLLDPPVPPKDATEQQLRDWKERYIHPGAFVEVAIDANRVVFYDPTNIQRRSDGHVVAWFRTELFRPSVADGLIVRSVRKQLEVDCKDWRYKELS